jgi:hypothetical protein
MGKTLFRIPAGYVGILAVTPLGAVGTVGKEVVIAMFPG